MRPPSRFTLTILSAVFAALAIAGARPPAVSISRRDSSPSAFRRARASSSTTPSRPHTPGVDQRLNVLLMGPTRWTARATWAGLRDLRRPHRRRAVSPSRPRSPTTDRFPTRNDRPQVSHALAAPPLGRHARPAACWAPDLRRPPASKKGDGAWRSSQWPDSMRSPRRARCA